MAKDGRKWKTLKMKNSEEGLKLGKESFEGSVCVNKDRLAFRDSDFVVNRRGMKFVCFEIPNRPRSRRKRRSRRLKRRCYQLNFSLFPTLFSLRSLLCPAIVIRERKSRFERLFLKRFSFARRHKLFPSLSSLPVNLFLSPRRIVLRTENVTVR